MKSDAKIDEARSLGEASTSCSTGNGISGSTRSWITPTPVSYTHLDVYKRQALRVEAYVGFLTDRYPPFSLDA